MTHNINYTSEINNWDSNTLRPPRYRVKDIVKDLSWHINNYKKNKLSFHLSISFLFLRIIQIIAYKKGWKKGELKI